MFVSLLSTKEMLQVIGFAYVLTALIPCGNAQDVAKFFSRCHKGPAFNECMKNAFNDMRIYFKTGKGGTFMVYNKDSKS